MALNWTMLDAARTPVPLNEDEMTVKTSDNADVTVVMSEGEGKTRTLKEKGKVYLTDVRFIFVRTATSPESPLDSLSIPLTSILSTKFQQPVFGANYLSIDVKPSPGGGLTEGTKAEIRLNDQGMFGFVNGLEKVREMAMEKKRGQMAEDELPTYSAPGYSESAAGSSSGASHAPPPAHSSSVPSDAPPGYDA